MPEVVPSRADDDQSADGRKCHPEPQQKTCDVLQQHPWLSAKKAVLSFQQYALPRCPTQTPVLIHLPIVNPCAKP